LVVTRRSLRAASPIPSVHSGGGCLQGTGEAGADRALADGEQQVRDRVADQGGDGQVQPGGSVPWQP
jgi:hypothetical protein